MIQSQEPQGFEKDTAILAMHGLCKSYYLGGEELRVLRDINRTITRGEYVAFMGRRCPGKSTLPNLMRGLEWST